MNSQIAVVGMGVMGLSLARNLHSRGLRVLGFDIRADHIEALKTQWPGITFSADYAQLAAGLQRPRQVLIMVTAGAAVDAVIGALRPHLQAGDVVVDGGNSHWPDTDRREQALRAEGLHFVGMGVSGGQEGALKGPSMMPGGSRASWEALRPLLEPAAAVSDTGPCVTWCGHGSAGHAVKMVHNGIEYGDMQLIAEAWSLLRPGRSPAQIAEVFTGWNAGRLQSFLVEITATIVAGKDPQGEGALVDPFGETTLRFHADVGYGHAVFVRGSGYPLSWERGEPATWEEGEVWTLRLAGVTGTLELKALIDDSTWEQGDNHQVEPGETLDAKPEF